MEKVFTNLDDKTVAKIKESGLSSYKFLQEAVEEKFQRDEIFENQKKEISQMITEQNKIIDDKFSMLLDLMKEQFNEVKLSDDRVVEEMKEWKEADGVTKKGLRQIWDKIQTKTIS